MLSEMKHIAIEILRDTGYQDLADKLHSADEWWSLLDQIEEPDPNRFMDAYAYGRAAQAYALFRKFEDFPGSPEQRRSAALKRWHDAEASCFHANRRFYEYTERSDIWYALPDRVRSILLLMRKMCRETLGPLPAEIHGRFGPGVVFETSGRFGKPAITKLSITPSATRNATTHLAHLRHAAWFRTPFVDSPWSSSDRGECNYPHDVPLDVVKGNRWTTVPKNRDTDRSIGVEPSINVFVQLGIGRVIRSRLRKLGLLQDPVPFDLNQLFEGHVDYPELFPRVGPTSKRIHMDLAQYGSLCGDLATIDLSAASDTVAYELVRFLLPGRWFDLLTSVRSPMTLIEDRWYRIEKFSSMGNGYTFELETLVFCMACRAVAKMRGVELETGRNFSVFGDDIVVPRAIAADVIDLLSFMGFSTNRQKTFIAGPFRESCGGDYFDGVDVRPVYIRTEPANPLDWTALHNKLWRANHISWETKIRVCGFCVSKIPTFLRVWGPLELGDQVLHGHPERMVWKKVRSRDARGIRGSFFTAIKVLRAVEESYPPERWGIGGLIRRLLYEGSSAPVTVSGGNVSYETTWVALAC